MHPEWWAARAKLGDPGRPTPGTVRFVRRFFRPFVRAFHRPRLEGTEHLPTSGPYLLVANHSAGLGISEILSFMVRYLDEVGPERPLAGFAHPAAFSVWPASAVLRGVGAIPSTYAAARAALAAGIPIIVFPGGDHETMRPVWQAERVDFGGRVGFLKVARQAGVPVVPMGICGSHYTAPMLWRARLFAYLFATRWTLGTKRWAISLLGVLGAAALLVSPLPLAWRVFFAWLWVGSPFSYLPFIPWTIRMRIGAPIAYEELFAEGTGDGALPAASAKVESRVQALVHALARR